MSAAVTDQGDFVPVAIANHSGFVLRVRIPETERRVMVSYLPMIYRPLTAKLAQQLLAADLYDGKYDENHDGLQGHYVAAIEGDEKVFEKFWVMYAEQRPIAIAAVRPYIQGQMGHHLHVYVHPDFRGQGVGSWLVDRAKSVGFPVLQAAHTELANKIFERHAINQIYPPTRMDREFTRVMRTLDPKHTWVTLGADGKPDSQMVSSDIRDLLQDLYDRAKKQDPRA